MTNTNAQQQQENENIVLSFDTEWTELEHGKEHSTLAMINLEGPATVESMERRPITLVAVIDRSGSMAGGKLELVKETLEFVIGQLKSGDHLSLVTFESGVKVDFPLLEMNAHGKKTALQIVQSLRTAGATNLSGGLFTGIEQLKQRSDPSATSTVLLLTDGHANGGIQDKTELLAQMEKIMQSVGTCSVFTFGFGSDHSEDLLQGIAQSGGGMYYFVEDKENIPEAFGDCLGGLLSVVAQNMKVELRAKPNVNISNVLNGRFAKEELIPNQHVKFNLGDLYGEEVRNLPFQLNLTALETPVESQELVEVKFSYFNTLTASLVAEELTVTVARPVSLSGKAKFNVALDEHKNRIASAEAMTRAQELGKKGNIKEGREELQKAIDMVAQSPSAGAALSKNVVNDMNQCLQKFNNQVEYERYGSKMMAMKSMNHCMQRASHMDELGGASYQTSSKARMKKMFKK